MAEVPVTIAALYRFAPLGDLQMLRVELMALCTAEDIRGTLLIAGEGINGTIAGTADSIALVIRRLRALPGCAELDVKYARADAMPFGRMKVRIKREIVTLGAGDLDPARNAGTYLDPTEWNALLEDPDVVLIDTRNAYEVAIGTFDGALDPETRAFGEFPAWFDAKAAEWRAEGRKPKLAMFCTGGIRCEKSTAFARERGFEEVYHLRGGILRYLEEMPEAASRWQGDCFVFDERVAVGHGLQPGGHVMCRACGLPVAADALDRHRAECAGHGACS